MTFAEIIREIDAWQYPLTLYVMMQLDEVQNQQQRIRQIKKDLAQYDPTDRQYTVIHMQLAKEQRRLQDDMWLVMVAAAGEKKFEAEHDGKGMVEFVEPTWTMQETSQYATMRTKWNKYADAARTKFEGSNSNGTN